MWDQLIILVAGTLGGFCSSAPLGAINLWVTDAILAKAESKIRAFLCGVVLADAAHAALASWGYHALLQERGVERWLAVIGGAFMVALGIAGIRGRQGDHQPSAHPLAAMPTARSFSLGVLLCGANPAFLIFWVFAIDQMERRTGLTITNANLALFLAGIVLGDVLWFGSLIAIARRGRDLVRPTTLRVLRLVIAMVFVVTGGTAIVRGIG